MKRKLHIRTESRTESQPCVLQASRMANGTLLSLVQNQFVRFVLVGLVLAGAINGCPNHQHDFREKGFGVVKISVHSSVKWVTVGKTSLLGITVSSSHAHGSSQDTKHVYVKGTITVCSKCGMATGPAVHMTLTRLRQIAKENPALEPLLQKAITSQP